jgi:dihydropteroate synthase
LGIKDIVLDPGFGFAKTVDQNFAILNQLSWFRTFDLPILVGLSRKSMIWRTLLITADQAGNGTTALHMVALQRGASMLRAHDVAEARQCITLFQKLHQPL